MRNIIGGTKTGIFTVAALLVLSLCAVTYAGQGHRPGMRPPGPEGRGFGPPAAHLLDKAIHDNMAAEALSEITGKTLEVIKAELAASHMGAGAVLESNSVDLDTFKTLMNTKMSAAVQKAADCGLITAEQAAELIAKIASSASDADTAEDSESAEETESETAADTISETVQSAF
ncbi:MAG: hypothetical protein R2941_06705 [Desulfobacterales bacterium]